MGNIALPFDVCAQPSQLRDAMAEAGSSGPLRVLYRPQTGEPIAHWEAVGALAMLRRRVVLAIDEVDMLCSPWSWKRGDFWRNRKGTPALQALVNWGRHKQTAMLITARNPSAVHRDLTRNAREWVLFRDSEPNDLEYFASCFGAASVALLGQLRPYQYVRQIKGEAPRVAGPEKLFR